MKLVLRSWLSTPLWQRIMAALVLGALVGWLAGPQIESIRWMGDLFVRMIRMLVAPLVFVTLVAGITAMKEPTRIASIGGRAFGLYIVTTLGAIVIGLVLAGLLGPGRGVTLSEGGNAVELAEPVPLVERLLAIVPNNVFAAFAEGDILALIFFGVLLGVGVLLAGERGRPIGRLFESGADVMLKVTGVVMELAPFGVFALVAWVVGVQGAGAFINIFLLAAIVYGGGALQMLVVHGGLVRALGKMRIRDFFAAIRTPQVLAFSTSSSAATLPATLTAAETNLKIRPPVASSVIPLGATINMDGTALYVAAVAVFAAQAFGVPLSLGDYALIALTTTFVSIGTASVPSASLFLMATVLDVVGLSGAQIALVIGLILPFDRLLDMWRTVVNVTGDLAVARVVAASVDELETVEEASPVASRAI